MDQEKCYGYNLMQVPVLHVVPLILFGTPKWVAGVFCFSGIGMY